MDYKLYEIQLSIVLRSFKAFDWLISESVLATLYEKVYKLIQVCLHSKDSRISSTDQTQRVPPCHLNQRYAAEFQKLSNEEAKGCTSY